MLKITCTVVLELSVNEKLHVLAVGYGFVQLKDSSPSSSYPHGGKILAPCSKKTSGHQPELHHIVSPKLHKECTYKLEQ